MLISRRATDDEYTLLRALLDKPWQDDRRLAYADWLARRRDPLAELIRLDTRLDGLGPDDRLRRELEARRRELLAEHRGDWVSQDGVFMNWSGVVALLKHRLTDAIAWCRNEAHPKAWYGLWSPPLRPAGDLLRGTGSSRSARLTAGQRKTMVNAVADARRALQWQGRSHAETPAPNLGGGAILLFDPDRSASDGMAAQFEEWGFFDPDNTPPWDTWLVYVDEPTRAAGEPFASYLAAWISPWYLAHVGWAVENVPNGCLRWARDADTTLTRNLAGTGLLVGEWTVSRPGAVGWLLDRLRTLLRRPRR